MTAELTVAWHVRLTQLETEIKRLKDLIDASFKRDRFHNELGSERVSLVIKSFALENHASDIKAILNEQHPPKLV